MARQVERLTALQVKRATQKGMLPDGAGLYLRVSASGGKSWILRYMLNGKPREMGLGPLNTYSLAEARKRAKEARQKAKDGIDPINSRKEKILQQKLNEAKTITFDECAKQYIHDHKAGWSNSKHIQQWENTLNTYASPTLGHLSTNEIDTDLVHLCIKQIWTTKPETANRVRARIASILDWAEVKKYRTGKNPAALKGNLDKLLPKLDKVKKVRHHPALPYEKLPAFIKQLHKQEGVAALALEFTILTAARTGEVIGAKWSEIDFENNVWTIPEARMKADKEHQVPLTKRAQAILKQLKDSNSEFIFPGGKPKKGLSNNAMRKLLERMKHSDITVHGFRSTFRDWAAERTNFTREVVEKALAHSIKDKAEKAYQRGHILDKRRNLMNTWEQYTTYKKADVIAINKQAENK